MPIDVSEAIESLQSSLDVVPAALAAIILLAGPTVVYVFYRVVILPRNSRDTDEGGGLLWMCIQCRSANEVRESRCYRCGLERTTIDGDMHVVDGDEIVTLAPDEEPTYPPDPPALVGVMASADDPVMMRVDGHMIAAGATPASAAPPVPTVVPPVTPRRLVVVPGKAATGGDSPMVPVGPGTTTAEPATTSASSAKTSNP